VGGLGGVLQSPVGNWEAVWAVSRASGARILGYPAPVKDLRRFLNALPRQVRRQKLLIGLYRAGLVDPIQRLDFNAGGRAWVDLRDAESRASYIAQNFWPEFPPIVAAFLQGSGDLFDVGANFGLVTFGVVQLVQGRSVHFHLFEANPAIVQLLHRSAAEWPGEQFAVTHCCVTDHPGISHLTLPSASWGHAFIGGEGIPAPNLILDDYITGQRVQRIAFLKMDVNGSEPFALRGTARALAAGTVEAAFVEVARESLAPTGVSADDLLRLMQGFGFDAYFCALWDKPDPFGLTWVWVPVHGALLQFASASPLPPSYVQGDVLFLHRGTPLAATLRGVLPAPA
jgi:FkbM family methyltransferase